MGSYFYCKLGKKIYVVSGSAWLIKRSHGYFFLNHLVFFSRYHMWFSSPTFLLIDLFHRSHDKKNLHGIRLPVNWVQGEWDSMLTEPIVLRFLSFPVDSIDMESGSVLAQLTRSLTPRWLALTGNETARKLSHSGNIQISNISANSRIKLKPLKSLILWPIYMHKFDTCKKSRLKILMQLYFSTVTLHLTGTLVCRITNYLAVLVSTEYNLENRKHINTFINCKMNDYQLCYTDYSFSG